MKLEIYNAQDASDNVVRMRLIMEHSTIKLIVVDADGKTVPGGYLLGFETGKRGFYLCTSIASSFGFPLTDDGRLRAAVW